MPWVNRLVDAVRETTGLEHGVALPAWDALVTGGYPGLAALARDAADGQVKFAVPGGPRTRRRRGRPRAPPWAGASRPSTRGGPAGVR
jgi:beta-lysine 5,6-aminomutase alpha subunit